jgi:hypothetical protein
MDRRPEAYPWHSASRGTRITDHGLLQMPQVIARQKRPFLSEPLVGLWTHLRSIPTTSPPNHARGASSPNSPERAGRSTALSPLWWCVLSVCGLFAFLSLTAGASEGSAREIAIFASVSAILSLLCVRQVYPTRESSASFLFVLCFSLFNLGLAPFVALGISVPTFGLSSYDTTWLYATVFPRALALCTIGLLSLLVGTTLGRLLGRNEIRKPLSPAQLSQRDAVAGQLGFPAALLMAATVLAFFVIALSHGGIRVFIDGYGNWSSSTQGTPLPYVYALIGVEAGILAVSSKSRAKTVGFLCFAAFALPALAVGLRGEVLFPIVAAVVMGGFHSQLLNGKRFLVVLVVALLAVSAIRTFRDAGFAGTTSTSNQTISASFSALDGLAEMGYSLRPTVVVVQWHDQGQPALDGGSFMSPFVRLAHSALPVLGRNTPVQIDPDVLNSVVLQRVGPIGFSQTAEAYDNWGTAGVIGVLLVIGLVLSWIDRSPLTLGSLLIRNSVFVPLLIEVRNTFTAVPAQILLGLVVSATLLVFARHRSAQRSLGLRQALHFQPTSHDSDQ